MVADLSASLIGTASRARHSASVEQSLTSNCAFPSPMQQHAIERKGACRQPLAVCTCMATGNLQWQLRRFNNDVNR
jgi:hypothetical protein